MTINYKKELEKAAKSMILIHEPKMLIKLVVRMIVQKVKVSHAGILLEHKNRDTYILTVSRGELGLKIPAGFARFDADSPMIQFFKLHKDKEILGDGALVYKKAMQQVNKKPNAIFTKLLKSVLRQMEILGAVVCVPCFFREELLGIILLGNKVGSKDFSQEELDFFIAIASDVAMAIRNAQLFKELESELEKKHNLFIHTTIALAAAIDAKDHYTHGHTARVTNLSLQIARKLMDSGRPEIDDRFLELLHIASLLHDIGKIGIPESILNKNGPLTEEEKRRMAEHPKVGATILEPIKELEEPILGVKYHHERFDGSGYPEGLKGDQIPLIAAIISVADTFDAMNTDRPYRKALPPDKAMSEIRREGGRQLNPEVVKAFVALYEEGRI